MPRDFATFDFETTGVKANTDRVIEVGIVRTSPTGVVISEFNTLINPVRDVGPTEIHGISAGMLGEAPSFAEIAGDIAEILNGAILVAHNANFDKKFLASELTRIDRQFLNLEALCTLELMYAIFPSGPRKLVDCCWELGIEVTTAHCAIDDARMTSQLFHMLRERLDLSDSVEPAWIDPVPPASRRPLPRDAATNPRETEASFLAGLIARLPLIEKGEFSSAASAAEYLNLLDRVLEDRKIEHLEAEALVNTALDLKLSGERVQSLHAAYVANLCAVAVEDHVVTTHELEDLRQVALLLKVSDWESLLTSSNNSRRIGTPKGEGLKAGMSVCFTGQMSESRETLEFRSLEAGLIVKSGVVKKLDVLVLADTDSSSGKARKARDYGIRIITEAVFLKMLSEMA